MKIAVRALVLGMLITGFAADHVLATQATPKTATTIASNSAVPVPSCEPGSGCGFR